MDLNIVELLSTLGAGSVLTILVNKFFTRKVDKINYTSMQFDVAERIIKDLQTKLNRYIDMTEKLMKDVACLQENLHSLYPLSCIIEECPNRKLLESDKFKTNVSVNDSD